MLEFVKSSRLLQEEAQQASRNVTEFMPQHHLATQGGKMGVLLVNLGTPDSTSVADVKKYLREFLSDPKVVELPRILWLPLLYGFISVFKAPKSAENYKKIWNKSLNDSPLRIITRGQFHRLNERIGSDDVIVQWAMRYGNPSIESKINNLKQQGCDRILLVPLYPQYSATTTATAVDEVNRVIKHMRWQPAISVLPAYFDHAYYIDALAKSSLEHFYKTNFKPDAILASFHGLPATSLTNGDPYYCQAIKTSRLLAERLGLGADGVVTSFQSRFGKAKWLQPYTLATVKKLASQGVKKLAVITPGFSADCLETLEEICMEIKADFINAGGTEFSFIPCLNDSDIGIDMLHNLVNDELHAFNARSSIGSAANAKSIS
ncbi:MAG: ferrochelatase [Rhizobiales bacterium]|nr:ferrochelatase [Hyphomicrobiales bacterium]